MASPSDSPPTDPDKVAPPAPEDDAAEEKEMAIPATFTSIRFLVVAGLSVLAAGLLVGLVVQMRKVSNRDQLLTNRENRAVQVQASLVELHAQIESDKADTDRLRQKFNESTQRVKEMTTAAEKLASTSAETQILLDDARAAGTQFQTEMAAAKVAALEQKGLAEVAQTQVDVIQVQMKQATAVATQLRQDLTASKSEVADLQEQLQKAQAMIVTLQKPRK